MSIPPVTVTAAGNPSLTPKEFQDQVLNPRGKINKQYGLGYASAPRQQDISNDGQADLIYSFSSGKTVFLITNYGEEVQTGTRDEEQYKETPVYGTKIEYGTKQESYSYTEQDCTERDAAKDELKNGNWQFSGKPVIINGVEAPGPDMNRKNELEAIVAAGCKTVSKTGTRTVTDYSDCKQVLDYDNIIDYKREYIGTKTVPIMKPVANWNDIDGDGNTREQVIGHIPLRDNPDTFDIETYAVSRMTVVLEDAPPPPPPPPPPKPKEQEKDYLDLFKQN